MGCALRVFDKRSTGVEIRWKEEEIGECGEVRGGGEGGGAW